MFRWIPYAFVRITLFFCSGILLGINFLHALEVNTTICLFLFILSFYVTAALMVRRRPALKGALAMAAIFIGGFLNVQLKQESNDVRHLSQLNEKIHFYQAVVTQPAQDKGSRWKGEITVQLVRTDHGWRKRIGKVMFYAEKKHFAKPFTYGDVLLVTGAPTLVPGPLNPHEFDYRKYLEYRQIHHQHFFREGNVHLIDHRAPDQLLNHAISARVWADKVLQHYIPGKREQALASALVLGVTEGLDNELMNAYAATGAMHVLSVSGLHVGIVYGLLLLLFKPFHRFKSTKWVLLGVSLTILWAYAFITGISASVLRAVTMFSFAAIAKPWNHRTNIYNILAASAFCLLVYDPFMIMSVGFQLSYLAVTGIVAMQPGLYRLWEPKYWVWDEIWKVAAVSIAAQLATVSIGLFYFHQFPNYFLITNMIVIPGSFIVLILGIVMLISSFIEPVVQLLGWLMHWIIKILNAIVFGIEQIPFSVLDGIYINALQCWIGIIAIGVVLLWLESKKNVWLVVASLLCLIFSGTSWYHFVTTIRSSSITVYALKGSTAIDLSTMGKTDFIMSSTLMDESKAKFHILPNRLVLGATGVGSGVPSQLMTGCSLTVWKGKSILRIDSPDFKLPRKLAVDLLVLSNNAVRELKSIVSSVSARYLVLDSSNSYKNATSIVIQGRELNIDVYSVLDNGAFQIKF